MLVRLRTVEQGGKSPRPQGGRTPRGHMESTPPLSGDIATAHGEAKDGTGKDTCPPLIPAKGGVSSIDREGNRLGAAARARPLTSGTRWWPRPTAQRCGCVRAALAENSRRAPLALTR